MRSPALSAPSRASALAVAIRAARLALFAVVASAALFLGACDNPACVFGGDCSQAGVGGALGTLSASVPEDGQILRPAPPTLQRFAPMGNAVDPQTPIVLVFSEAMSNTNLNIAFQIESAGFGTLPLQATALVGDGRVLVLFPIMALMPGATYRVLYREDVVVGDRTGQALAIPADRVAGTFTVAGTAPTSPGIVLTYPLNSELGLPATTEITVVFSRPMDEFTVNSDSFQVEVDGAEPPFDVEPMAVDFNGLATDPRVFRWRSVDDQGQRASLGTDVEVTVDLSPVGAQIEDTTGEPLLTTTFSFRTLPFSAPLSAEITSFPTDAIGINSLTGPADLAVRVDLEDAQVGDEIGVFLFGVQPEMVEVPLTIALFRSAILTDPPDSFTFTAAELDLVRTTSPLAARLRDGAIGMAFRVKRGSLESPVRVLDVDALLPGAQGPVLDTVPPTLMGVDGTGTSTGAIASDQRDVVVVGRASEGLRGAFVSTMLGDNEIDLGEVPPVVGSDPLTGFFIAAPVRAGILQRTEQPLTYSLTIYDLALNASGTAMGTYVQRGAAASGFPRPFASVSVEVFDALTRAPIAGATVYTHEDIDGSIFLAGTGTTGPDGTATLDPALIGRTLVTVVRTGYDLFTFDGLPTDIVSIPLRPSASPGATVGGMIAATDPTVLAFTRSFSDTRRPQPGETLAAVGGCTLDEIDQRYECNFGPVPIEARELGGATAMAVQMPPPSSLPAWSAFAYLAYFGLLLPLAEQAPGAAQGSVVVPMDALNTPGLDDELRALDVLPHALSALDWPMLPAAPGIRVEGLAPGLSGPLTLGQGVAFPTGVPSTYAVRAAYPGIADPFADGPRDMLGRLVARGTIEPDLFLRAEVVDALGARGIDRPRLSTTDLALSIPEAPTFGPAPIALNLTGEAYDVLFSDVLTDAAGQPGIHRLTLVDDTGRRWTVWRLDQPDVDGPDVVMHLPLALAGDPFPLAGPDVTATAASWSWTTFDATSFLWTDVEREFERAAYSAPEPITVP
jgi:hypothetical protein